MPKLNIYIPPPAAIATSPDEIKKIWDEADRESRKDAAKLRERRTHADRETAHA